MKTKQLGASLALAMVLAATVTAALADSRDDSRDRRPELSRYDDDRDRWDRRDNRPDRDSYAERARRDRVHDRVHRLIDQVQLAQRRDRLTNREADRCLDRLQRVNHFVHNDRHFTDEEFRRRMDDLDDIQRDLFRAADRRPYDRRDDYGRYRR